MTLRMARGQVAHNIWHTHITRWGVSSLESMRAAQTCAASRVQMRSWTARHFHEDIVVEGVSISRRQDERKGWLISATKLVQQSA